MIKSGRVRFFLFFLLPGSDHLIIIRTPLGVPPPPQMGAGLAQGFYYHYEKRISHETDIMPKGHKHIG